MIEQITNLGTAIYNAFTGAGEGFYGFLSSVWSAFGTLLGVK